MEEVLHKKFQVPPGKILEYAQDLLFMSEIVFPTGTTAIVKDDPDDNIIIETAALAKAEAIITGDQHLLRIKSYKGIKIVKASTLL
ncbi:MAG: hypothetical protein QCI38_08065 [Candidatus Thermoplasmatota archaeon]|nr:hypothetical protein [Candidatus Thermoplasmatota archaeon]